MCWAIVTAEALMVLKDPEATLTPCRGERAAPASMASASGSFSSAAIQVDIASVSGDHGHDCEKCDSIKRYVRDGEQM